MRAGDAEERPIVLALPRGGVVTAFEIARALRAPLDVLVVRKLGAPAQPEFGVGAIAPGGVRIVDRASMRLAGMDDEDLERVAAEETRELERRERRYRAGRGPVDVRGRTAILVDDGAAPRFRSVAIAARAVTPVATPSSTRI